MVYPPTQILRFPTPLSVPGTQGIRTWRRTFSGKTPTKNGISQKTYIENGELTEKNGNLTLA